MKHPTISQSFLKSYKKNICSFFFENKSRYRRLLQKHTRRVHNFRFWSLCEFDIEKLSNCCRHKNDRVSFTTFLNLIFGGILLFGQIVHRPQNTGGYRLPWVYMIKLYCNAVSVTAFPTNVQPRYQITIGSRFKGQSWPQSFIKSNYFKMQHSSSSLLLT